MQFNHVANRLDAQYFETVVEMLKSKLGFVELRRTERAIWLHQPGANVDLQFSRSPTANRDADKLRSQVSFLSETPDPIWKNSQTGRDNRACKRRSAAIRIASFTSTRLGLSWISSLRR
jgi:hypothetical protein